MNRVVDYQELALGITMHSTAPGDEVAEFYFDVFDTDKSGSLDRHELLRLNEVLLRFYIGMVAAKVESVQIRRMDIKANASDVKDFMKQFVHRLKEMRLEERVTDYIFQMVDKDNDSKITKKEYNAFWDDEVAREGLQSLIQSALQEVKIQAGVLEDGATQFFNQRL
jgi:Ca2+-binding EF-hand superfamily protein